MRKIFLSFLPALILCSFLASGQTCGSCTWTVSGPDTASYSVGPGQILCVDSTGIVTGNITLNGGAICNKGILSPSGFTFSSGNLDNYKSLVIGSAIILFSGSSLTNHAGASADLSAGITINGASLTNSGTMNVSENVVLGSGLLTNTSTGILNCNSLNNSGGTYTNNGIVNSAGSN